MKKWLKVFKKTTTTPETRAAIVGDWLYTQLREIGTYHDLDPKKVRRPYTTFIQKIDEKAKKFCGRPVLEGWKLHKDWFKMILVQSTKGAEGAETLFKLLQWDYEKLLTPQFTETLTVTSVLLYDKDISDIEVKLLLTPVSHYPVGSIWMNKKSAKLWRLNWNYHDSCVELEPGEGNETRLDSMVRKVADLNANFVRIK